MRVLVPPSVNDRQPAAVNGPGPASQAQHGQDEGPDELAVGVGQRRPVPLRPRVVNKPLDVLQKGQRSRKLTLLWGTGVPSCNVYCRWFRATSAGNVMVEICSPYWKDPPTPSTRVSRYSLQYCVNMAG